MITRRLNPVLQKCSRHLVTRNLHSTPRCKAKAKVSPRIRSIRRSQNSPGVPIGVNKHFGNNEALPPISMLRSARNSGAINTEPTKALEFLNRYLEVAKSATGDWEQKLCDEHEITPFTLSILAGILRRCTSTPQKVLAKELMLSASKLGEKSATFELILSAINTDSLHAYQTPLHRLNHLAKVENDPEAMALLGKVLASQRKEEEALEWLRKTTRAPTGSLDHDGAGTALVGEGMILLNLRRPEEAEEAFRKAALVLDEPQAYFQLARFQGRGSETQKHYLSKAAGSGVVEACHDLGVLELAKIDEAGMKLESMSDFGMAREWFQLAADAGNGSSMLKMALMLRAIGMQEGGLSWVERAVDVPNVKKQAAELKERWAEEEVNPDTLHIFNVYR